MLQYFTNKTLLDNPYSCYSLKSEFVNFLLQCIKAEYRCKYFVIRKRKKKITKKLQQLDRCNFFPFEHNKINYKKNYNVPVLLALGASSAVYLGVVLTTEFTNILWPSITVS